jgi:hypothetical protein
MGAYSGIHLSQFLDMATYDVPRNDTSNEFNHSKEYPGRHIDRKQGIGIPVSVDWTSVSRTFRSSAG